MQAEGGRVLVEPGRGLVLPNVGQARVGGRQEGDGRRDDQDQGDETPVGAGAAGFHGGPPEEGWQTGHVGPVCPLIILFHS